MKRFIFIIFPIILLGCGQPKDKNPRILIVTSYGDIEVELYPRQAPKTVAAFLSYIDSGFYYKSSFYRVLISEGLTSEGNIGLLQGGIWQTNPAKLVTLPGIIHESTNITGLSHKNGAISLARSEPGTANTEFFICVGDQSQFDYGNKGMGDGLGFAVFGSVLKGMRSVRKIQVQKKKDQVFVRKIIIHKIKRLS